MYIVVQGCPEPDHRHRDVLVGDETKAKSNERTDRRGGGSRVNRAGLNSRGSLALVYTLFIRCFYELLDRTGAGAGPGGRTGALKRAILRALPVH